MAINNDAIFKSVNDDDNPDKYNKWLDSTYDVFNGDSERKITKKERSELEDLLDKNLKEIKELINRIGDLSKLTLEQKNFFLYDESNYINHTFYTELNKKIQVYGLISTHGIGIKSSELVTPQTSLKFNVLEDKYKEKIVLTLEDIRRKQKLNVKDKKITNFAILASSKKNKIGIKRKMSYTIINEVKIGGVQSFDRFDKLNPVEVRITISEVSTFLSRFTRNKYRFIVNNLLFSSSLKKDTNVIFVCCNGLNEAKEALTNGKFEKTVGIVNISQCNFNFNLINISLM